MSFTIGVKEKMREKISNTSVIACVAIKKHDGDYEKKVCKNYIK